VSSGWGCQHLTKYRDEKEWCRLLGHKCDPGCKGCVLYGVGIFTNEHTLSDQASEERKVKKRSDNPLGER